MGCRRITPGINYLESLVKDNVEVVFGGISHFTETGIVDDKGVERPYDVISKFETVIFFELCKSDVWDSATVCATGFDVSFGARFTFVGRDGRELDEAFGADPKSYLCGAPSFLAGSAILRLDAPIGAWLMGGSRTTSCSTALPLRLAMAAFSLASRAKANT